MSIHGGFKPPRNLNPKNDKNTKKIKIENVRPEKLYFVNEIGKLKNLNEERIQKNDQICKKNCIGKFVSETFEKNGT